MATERQKRPKKPTQKEIGLEWLRRATEQFPVDGLSDRAISVIRSELKRERDARNRERERARVAAWRERCLHVGAILRTSGKLSFHAWEDAAGELFVHARSWKNSHHVSSDKIVLIAAPAHHSAKGYNPMYWRVLINSQPATMEQWELLRESKYIDVVS